MTTSTFAKIFVMPYGGFCSRIYRAALRVVVLDVTAGVVNVTPRFSPPKNVLLNPLIRSPVIAWGLNKTERARASVNPDLVNQGVAPSDSPSAPAADAGGGGIRAASSRATSSGDSVPEFSLSLSRFTT